jgi:hypothetical protein
VSAGTTATDQPAGVRVLGRVPLHPLLAAVWPALTLWAANIDEVLPREVWPVLWQPALAVLAVWALASLALRSLARGALVATAVAGIALNAGRIAGDEMGTGALLGAAMVVLGAIVLAWWLPHDATLPVTGLLNVLTLVLVVTALPAIVTTWRPGGGAAPAAAEDAGGLAGRDIVYIVPDRYPRADTLQGVFGFDNSEFIGFLEDRGFQVAERSLANYPKTAHSLAATWNLAPLPELIPDPPADGSDWGPLYARLRDHRLGRIVQDAGYDYIHLGSWWSPTSTATTADRVLRVDDTTEFETVWRSQTLLPAIVSVGGEPADVSGLSLHERNLRYSSYALDQLDRLALQRSSTPRFVLAHLTLPHPPYVFDADGTPLSVGEVQARTREENFSAHVTYLNTRLRRLVEELTSGPRDTWPVIVIQSDEGPHPAARTGPDYDWTTAPTEVLEEKLRTFSAILLPGSDVVVPEDLTGIDTWRLVLDATIGTDLGPYPDAPVAAFPGEQHLYEFVDVRDRVR